MYDRRKEYLRRREEKMHGMGRPHHMEDYAYGRMDHMSHMDSRRGRRDRMYEPDYAYGRADHMMDYRDMRYDGRAHRDRAMGSDSYSNYGNYGYDGTYGGYGSYDGYGYDYAKGDQKYHEDLKKWVEKMRPRDRFKVPKDQIIQLAKAMGADFNEYDEEEFYAIYLAMLTDYSSVANEHNTYIKMAKDFLHDDDIAVSPSEKVCIYLYDIVMGENE